MYKIKRKKPKYFDFDLVVLGTGAGGGVAAHLAARMGWKVAAVEADRIGGECPNFGCVPTKSLLQAAEAYMTARQGEEFGIHVGKLSYDYEAVKHWKDSAVRRTGAQEGAQVYHDDGIMVVKGRAHFLDPWTVSVHGLRFKAKRFVIATGTTSFVPPIEGLKEAGFITYREAIDYTALPKSIFIIGGGAIGVEFAHLFSTFEVDVHVADIAPRLITQEDSEVGDLIAAVFEERDIKVHLAANVVRVDKTAAGKTVHFEKDGQSHSVTVDEVMVASGKLPNLDFGLGNAGVEYNKRGIKVNRYMQTSARHIFAAGDVVGPYGFTHMAAYQSRIAFNNMFRPGKKIAARYHGVPRCVFIDPEVACVGATEQQLKDKGVPYQVGASSISMLGRANTSGEDTGFVKVLADKKGRLLGAAIVSPRAGEVVHELTLAITHRMRARAITETIHAYPTWSETVRLACLQIKSK